MFYINNGYFDLTATQPSSLKFGLRHKLFVKVNQTIWKKKTIGTQRPKNFVRFSGRSMPSSHNLGLRRFGAADSAHRLFGAAVSVPRRFGAGLEM